MDTKPKSLFFPALLIVLGVLILLVNTGRVEGSTWDNLVKFWPVILILGGLDGLYRRDGWVGPLVLLGLGTILLLGNLNYLPVSAFSLLVRLWPILLVAIGLDLAFGSKGSPLSVVIRISFGILIVVAILWLSIASPYGVGIKSEAFSQSLDGATSSNVSFLIGAGKLSVEGGAAADTLVAGEASLPRNMELDPSYSPPEGGKSRLRVSGNNEIYLPFVSSTAPWYFEVNDDVALDLIVKVGAGEVDVNLGPTQTKNLETEMALGKMVVALPCQEDLQANVDLALGEIQLFLPKSCPVKINLETGLTMVELPDSLVRINDQITRRDASSTQNPMEVTISLAMGRLTIYEIE